MNKHMKNAIILSGGIVIGFGAGCLALSNALISSETFGPAIKSAISERIAKSIRQSFDRSEYDRMLDIANDVRFPTKSGAEEALTHLKDIISNSGFASISDYYDLVGCSTNIRYMSTEYGWADKDIEKARVIITDKNAYTIRFDQIVKGDVKHGRVHTKLP